MTGTEKIDGLSPELVEKVARALCKSHKLSPDAKIACLNPEHHHKPQWVTFTEHAQAAITAHDSAMGEALDDEIAALTAAHERMGEIGDNAEAQELYVKIEALTDFRAALANQGAHP